VNFLRRLALQGGKKLDDSSRRLTCFFSASVTRKNLQFGTWTAPLSNDAIDFVLRHREVGRAKDLSALPRISRYSLPTHFVSVIQSDTKIRKGWALVRLLFHERYLVALPDTAARDALVQMDILPRACAAISAALLSRSRRWMCCQPLDDSHLAARLAAASLCRAASWEAMWTAVLFPRAALSRAALSGKLLCSVI